MLIRLKQTIRDVARQIDRAITLGVAAMYPLVFNVPAPDPVPDWKKVVGLGWKVVKVTLAESRKALKDIRGHKQVEAKRDEALLASPPAHHSEKTTTRLPSVPEIARSTDEANRRLWEAQGYLYLNGFLTKPESQEIQRRIDEWYEVQREDKS